MITVRILPTIDQANQAAADLLARWLSTPNTRNLMLAGGNTPLPLYGDIANRELDLSHLHLFPLDEYVGVPPSHPRTCSNLLRQCVAEAWHIPPEQFFSLDTTESGALAGIRAHEQRIDQMGGLDAIVLGLGTNGHLGFNEPGSSADCAARVVDLDASSIEANRRWFQNEHAPTRGATVGLRTILAARLVLILAYGPAKAGAVRAMVGGPIGVECPASFLRRHPHAHLFLEPAAAVHLGASAGGVR